MSGAALHGVFSRSGGPDIVPRPRKAHAVEVGRSESVLDSEP